MKTILKITIFTLLSSISLQSFADFSTDVSTFYYSDSLSYSGTTTTSSRMFYCASINLALDKDRRYSLGWSILGLTAPDKETVNKTYSASDMGFRFAWNIIKAGTVNFAFTYNLKASATYSPAGTPETLRGTSLFIELGYLSPITEDLLAGIKINYYVPTFTESLVGSNTYSVVTDKRAMIFPTLAASWRF
jgi:hypothetical protein